MLLFTFWPLATHLSHAIAFVVLFGIVSGTVIGIPPACVASLLAESEQQRLGQWTGMMYTMTAAFSLVGPVIVGQLVRSFDYLAVMGWSGTCLALAAGCTVVARCEVAGLKRRASV